jgi:NADH dehydrogenase [ubiquinone] 1 alpha subcomplex assembly factor 7
MTPLAEILMTRIRQTGPMRLSDYMAECLMHPVHGYYTQSEVFGTAGDFTTAPEISQMFGELIGLSVAQNWLDAGSPDPFQLVELGPGRGVLMADALRATRRVPGFHAAMRLVLVEASPRLASLQATRLAPFAVTHLSRVQDLPALPTWVIANEFFDALPIRQFTRTAHGWHETMVGLDGERLSPGLGPQIAAPWLDHRLQDTAPGQIVELCAAAGSILSTLSDLIVTQGGMALVIDYGAWRGTGDTFQALRAHRPTDPFAEPGMVDLTTHVDFAELARSASPLRAHFDTQGAVLTRLGIGLRAEALAKGLSAAALKSHRAAVHRLTQPGEMGDLFKMLALCAGTGPLPAGFDHV